MCGITGILLSKPKAVTLDSVNRMTQALIRRGPDAGATFVDEDAGVALGHRRLAIVELSERGAQPMYSANRRLVIVFNGEIYNHLDLRRELQLHVNVEWRGSSDTETLVECFSAWGVSATLSKAVGMFAFALWDRREQRLTLARDRFGEKPLYYGYVNRGNTTAFLFGSELKALRAFEGFDNPIDRGSLALFLRFSYVPTPWTIHQDVFKLEPGSMLELTSECIASRKRVITPYWSYESVVAAGRVNPINDAPEAIDELERTLSESVRLQLVADVPIGAFLSGGIDSSTIVALMQAQTSRRVKTFTIGFDDVAFDESPHAREVACHLGTEHHEIRVTSKEARDVIPHLAQMYDEPFGDSSQIPTSIVCAVARREVTVALSGDAGDEIFCGYNRYTVGPRLWGNLTKIPPFLRTLLGHSVAAIPDGLWATLTLVPGISGAVAPFKNKAYKLDATIALMNSVEDLYRALVTEWSEANVPVLGRERRPTRLDDITSIDDVSDPVMRMMLLDGLTYLPDDILTKVDRAAMAVSLESRMPFLDHRVVELAWRLPASLKVHNDQGKWALRQILYRHVPQALVDRPKSGFAVPIGQWLRQPLHGWADELLSECKLREQGFLDATVVRRLWAEHCSGRRDWTGRLWNILMFQVWLEDWERSRLGLSLEVGSF